MKRPDSIRAFCFIAMIGVVTLQGCDYASLCHSKDVRQMKKVGNAIFSSDGQSFATTGLTRAYRLPVGICTFPDGGSSRTVIQTVQFFIASLKNPIPRKIGELTFRHLNTRDMLVGNQLEEMQCDVRSVDLVAWRGNRLFSRLEFSCVDLTQAKTMMVGYATDLDSGKSVEFDIAQLSPPTLPYNILKASPIGEGIFLSLDQHKNRISVSRARYTPTLTAQELKYDWRNMILKLHSSNSLRKILIEHEKVEIDSMFTAVNNTSQRLAWSQELRLLRQANPHTKIHDLLLIIHKEDIVKLKAILNRVITSTDWYLNDGILNTLSSGGKQNLRAVGLHIGELSGKQAILYPAVISSGQKQMLHRELLREITPLIPSKQIEYTYTTLLAGTDWF